MHHLFAIALLLASQAAVGVRVTTVDEHVVEGDAVQLDAQQLVLSNASGQSPATLAIDQLLRIDLEPTRRQAASAAAEVWLVDGSRLVVAGFATTGRRCTLQLPFGTSDNAITEFEAPLAAIKAVRLQPLPKSPTALATEWRELLAAEAAGDMIVIRKPEATNLNFVEGTLGNADASSVQFTLDEQTLDVNREKVFGMIYYRSAESATPRVVLRGPGLLLNASSVALGEGSFVANTAELGEIAIPLEAIQTVDYSIDRLQYLSDLEPTEAVWTPPPTAAPLAPLVDGVVRDRGIYTPQLTLEFPASALPAATVGSSGLPQKITYNKGLALRSPTEISYRVPGGFSHFRATAGIDPETRRTGLVEFSVLGDGKVLFHQTLAGGDSPVQIDCEVTNVRKLTLVVGVGPGIQGMAGTGDNLNLAEARFTK